ncbi:MAG: NAD(P)/FAD-dependent oxidoreductase [Pseudomonadota bacterium]
MAVESDLVAALGELDFDPDTVRNRFLAERDKRLRKDANDQFIEVTGEFSNYKDDPYIEEVLERDPLTDTVQVAIIGGGFGGLLMGGHLRKAGFEDIRMIEQGSDFGGTWYWNRYPGAMCDVESYIYLPLLEELDYMPEHKYSLGPEILDHSRRIATHYNLYENACLQTAVTELRWLQEECYWQIKTNRGDCMRARFVVMANGPLNRPKLPAIPGINDFQGHSFHTSRWDYAYTGGDTTGGLTGLKDKRVAVIGTGATAIQCVPHLGEWSKELYVFQRTPSMVNPRDNRETDEAMAESLRAKPNWQRARMNNFQSHMEGAAPAEDDVEDGWTELLGRVSPSAVIKMMEKLDRELSEEEALWLVEMEDYKKMHEVYDRVDSIVEDADVANALKPQYRAMCKRPCFHDEYLQTFNLPNVTLVDTKGKGVDQFLENGVRVGDTDYEVDCIVFATGFELGTEFCRRCDYQIYGRDGVSLTEYWSQGRRSFQSYMVHSFPNLFNLAIGHNGWTPNQTHALAEGANHVTHILQKAVNRDAKEVEVSEAAQDRFVEEFNTLIDPLHKDFFEACTPGYFNNEGDSDAVLVLDEVYGGGAHMFFQQLADWREEGSCAGVEFR